MKLCGTSFYFFATYVYVFPIQYEAHVEQALFIEQEPRIIDLDPNASFCLIIFLCIRVLGNC